MRRMLLTLVAALLIVSKGFASQVEPAPQDAWDLWQAEAERGRSVGWLDGDEVSPLARSGRVHPAPIATERHRIVIQSAERGFVLEGGVVAEVSPAIGCELQLFAAFARPYDPNPMVEPPSEKRTARAVLIHRLSNGEGRLATPDATLTADVLNVAGVTGHLGVEGNALHMSLLESGRMLANRTINLKDICFTS